MSSERKFQLFLTALAVLGCMVVCLATSSYGPGLSTDGARYLSTAESIVAGRGITDYLGLPLVNWPPLYPLLLAGLHLLTGWDVLFLAQVVNILSFGAIIYLGGIFFQRSLPGQWVLAAAASLVLATSLPLIEVSANAASDPLFLVCVLLFLLVARRYLRQPTRLDWWRLVALAVAACFLRYAGLALVFSGGLVAMWAWRTELKRAVIEAAAFGLVAGGPLAAWALLHNLPANGTLLGTHRPALALDNFMLIFEKMVGWFVPGSLLTPLLATAIFALLIAVLLTGSQRQQRTAWVARLQSPALFATLAFAFVYAALLVFTLSTVEHTPAGSQRIHAVLLPAFLALAGSALLDLAPRLNIKARLPVGSLLLAGFMVWLALPVYRVQAYVRASTEHGDVSYYNLYNTGTLRESDIVAHIQSMELGEDQQVYSNNEGAAWFYLRRRIYRLPRYDADAGESLATVMQDFSGWPAADQQATLVWFERELDYKELVPTPEQMAKFIRLTPTFTGRFGDVYLMDVE